MFVAFLNMGGQGRHVFFLYDGGNMDKMREMSEMMNQPPPAVEAPVLEPKSIKVFGVLHLVFGVIGVLGVVWGIINLIFGDALLKLQSGGSDEIYEMQKGMMKELQMPTMVALLFSLVVTVLILRAGFKLLKSKKDAVKAAAAYSYASIGAKVIGIILAVTYTIPAVNRHFDNITAQISNTAGGSGAAPMQSMMEMTKMMTSVSGVLSPILMCIYPILSLVLLKKKAVSDYLVQFGK